MGSRTSADAGVGPGLTGSYFAKPGLHSHNLNRRLRVADRKSQVLSIISVILCVLGLAGIGYYGYALANQYVYQRYENWAFDQQIAGHRNVSFADYLRKQTPFGFMVGEGSTAVVAPPVVSKPEPAMLPLTEGSVLGRVSIDRLNLTAIVREGVTAKTLSQAVGHVPSTALPGQTGNFAIAAHRDTLFRALKDIKKDDLVTFQSEAGTYTYKVLATKIVKPSDVSVIRPDGGGLVSQNDPAHDKLLTMITCYPFYYVGSAPQRFIVEAALVPPKAATSPPIRKTPTKQAIVTEPRHVRGFSHLSAIRKAKSTHGTRAVTPAMSNPPKKKKRFWRRLFGFSQG